MLQRHEPSRRRVPGLKDQGRMWHAPIVLGLVAGLLLLSQPRVARAQSGDFMGPRPEMITPEAERAIQRGLSYLAHTQNRDGSWRTAGGFGTFPVAMTSLAGLALMASGSTPVEGPYAVQVRRAVDYVVSQANPNGVIAAMDEESRPMHGHGFAMLFLGQAYPMERDELRREHIRRVLQKAVALTGRAQSRYGGWLYTPDSGSDEGSVTVTQIQGLRSVRNAGIQVPRSIIERACKYIELSANPDGGIRYRAEIQGESRPPITAAAVATLYNAGEYDNPVAKRCLVYLKNLLAHGNTSRVYMGHEFYALFYTAQAMYLSSEANWKSFFPEVRDNLVARQAGDGSWEGDGVGKTYGTAIAVMVLELPYHYLPIMQR